MDMKQFYDTLYFWPKNGQAEIVNKAMKKKINFRYYSDGHVSHYYICLSITLLHFIFMPFPPGIGGIKNYPCLYVHTQVLLFVPA
jgi:hypothetical protein